jgi:predicted CXXCH cytochrome family protein
MKRVLVLGWAAALVFLLAGSLFAAVTGDCVNCHTMHNSQEGVVINADGSVEGLLVDDCIGCHSSLDSATIKSLGGSRIPVVYNQALPGQPLAGGNFHWVAGGASGTGFGDNYGHNVFGITGQDGSLAFAPGGIPRIYNQLVCEDCHQALKLGCRSCHLPMHHAPGDQSPIAEQIDGWYRFLGSAMNAVIDPASVESTSGVTGVEETNWEQNPSSTVHNVYKGTATLYPGGSSSPPVDNSIGSFCAGCHTSFHAGMQFNGWVRHPSDVVLPDDADLEYAGYTVYNPLAPVAKQTLDGTISAEVVPGQDLVTCLSCHRAHGSAHPDMLRWDYNECEAGTGTAANCGCFVCHTSKDAP